MIAGIGVAFGVNVTVGKKLPCVAVMIDVAWFSRAGVGDGSNDVGETDGTVAVIGAAVALPATATPAGVAVAGEGVVVFAAAVPDPAWYSRVNVATEVDVGASADGKLRTPRTVNTIKKAISSKISTTYLAKS